MSNYTYMVTNNINGKVYVGSHSWSGEGIDKNYYGSGIAISKAVKKYGKENFQVEVLYYYDTVEECRADEERILTEYNVKDCPHSYNIKNSAIGFTSEDMTGEKHPMYGKRGEDSPLFGKHRTEETRQKISQSEKGKTVSDETRQKISQAKKGKKRTDETRQKISQANNYRKTPVVAIQKDTGKIRAFESITECSRVLGASPGHIYNCLKGRQKTCKGYTLKYVEQLDSGIYEGML